MYNIYLVLSKWDCYRLQIKEDRLKLAQS
jgi:hypothetical protein